MSFAATMDNTAIANPRMLKDLINVIIPEIAMKIQAYLLSLYFVATKYTAANIIR